LKLLSVVVDGVFISARSRLPLSQLSDGGSFLCSAMAALSSAQQWRLFHLPSNDGSFLSSAMAALSSAQQWRFFHLLSNGGSLSPFCCQQLSAGLTRAFVTGSCLTRGFVTGSCLLHKHGGS